MMRKYVHGTGITCARCEGKFEHRIKLHFVWVNISLIKLPFVLFIKIQIDSTIQKKSVIFCFLIKGLQQLMVFSVIRNSFLKF